MGAMELGIQLQFESNTWFSSDTFPWPAWTYMPCLRLHLGGLHGELSQQEILTYCGEDLLEFAHPLCPTLAAPSPL